MVALIFFILLKFGFRRIHLIFIFAFLLGLLRIYTAQSGGLDTMNVQRDKAVLYGFVCDEPDRRDDFAFICVETQEFKMLAKTDVHVEFKYGNGVKLEGFLVSAPDYFKAKDIEYFMYYPGIFFAPDHSKSNIFFEFVIGLRGRISDMIENVFSEPIASFIAGLLIGMRKNIPDEILQSFNKIGLTHILAISGWNITIIIGFIAGIFNFLGRKLKVVFSLAAVAVFVLIVGGSPSVLRAGITGSIGLLALAFGRQGIPILALCASGFLMTFINPKILMADAGFQLSFLSTLGLICFMPRLGVFFERIPALFGLRDIFLATISSQIFILPIAITVFSRISIISPIANIIILPFMPVIMLFSFIAVAAGGVFLPAGRLFAVAGEAISKFIFWVSSVLGRLDFAYIDVYKIPTLAIAAYFIFILYFLVNVDMSEP